MPSLRRCFIACSLLLFACQTAFGQAPDPFGLQALRDRLGASAPTGAGVPIMQAEALEIQNFGEPPPFRYLANNANPEVAGRVIDRSGNGAISDHANSVLVLGFGVFTGVAPGVPSIDGFRVEGNLDAGDWFGTAYLNFFNGVSGGGLPVAMPNLRVQNHSWIGSGAFDATIQNVHRRYDFSLRQDNVVGVVGVNNGTGSPIPALLGNSYNAIAVGRTDANSSFGPSTGDVPGRSKPDIVAPFDSTSAATPVVSACAALLLQTGDQMGGGNAVRMETIKSVLLAGATKSEFAGLAQPWTRTFNGSYFEPLDRRFGAGELNVNNSHLILTAGEKNGTDLALDGHLGWDFETIVGVGGVRRYYFDLGNVENIAFSATATWLRRITPDTSGPDLFDAATASLATVELRLFNANPDFSLGTMIDSSVSPIDNVQNIFRTDLLGNRRFAIEVLVAGLPGGQADENVAVSWFTTFTPVAVPEPGTIVLSALGGAGMLAAVRRSRKRTRAARKKELQRELLRPMMR